ncbi:procathepsin L-like [Physella acuta]|uniref:procathepsin L-like n=1 Tax=Physella acuta TaxID=109671 RepID=UPI0027DE787F|nr:procathepsin L-like [Physella acuta]
MLRLVVLALAVCMTSASMEANWVIFKAKYNKTYTGEDDLTRRYIWESNVKTIEAHNELYAKGLKSYYLKENKYSDMSHEEFRATMKGFLSNQPLTPVNYSVSGLLRVVLPSAVDWRKEGYVTRVKDQGCCESGWAFSSTGGLEGQNFKLTGRLVELSESNLIDCSTGWGNHGCQGGSMQKAFQYIIDNTGIDTEESYPYQLKENTCNFKTATVGATVQSYVDVPSGREDALREVVATVGPVSAAIDTSHDSFHQYGGGVYDEPDCHSTHLNHGVLVVGFDTDSSGGDYWIVKNSYGTSWGQEGYIWMSRNKDNQCGIATEASYPVV